MCHKNFIFSVRGLLRLFVVKSFETAFPLALQRILKEVAE
jgi:hypothetical protein